MSNSEMDEHGYRETVGELHRLIQKSRSHRFTVSLPPSVAKSVVEAVGRGTSPSISYHLDLAARREIDSLLRNQRGYAELLEVVDQLEETLQEPDRPPEGQTRHSGLQARSLNDDGWRGNTVRLSGRTIPGVYLLMATLVDDPDVPHETESALVEAGIKKTPI